MSLDPAKPCASCGVVKSVSAFRSYPEPKSRSRRSDGFHPKCADCERQRDHDWYIRNRERRKLYSQQWAESNRDRKRATDRKYREDHADHLRSQARLRNYGITQERFDSLLVLQGDRCAICRDESAGGRGNFHVDHCHETGLVRGLLCHRCNTALGLMRDDVDILIAAADYIRSAPCL